MARTRLTESRVRTLRTSRPDEDHWHTGWHHAGQFGLRVSSTGRKTWVYISPTRRRRTLGTWPDLSLDDAMERAARLARRHGQGAATVADLVEHAERTLQDRHPLTRKTILGPARALIVPALGEGALVHEVRTPDLQRIVDDAEEAGMHGRAANVLGAIRYLFEPVVRRGWHEWNPAREVRLTRRRRERRVELDVDLLARVWRACDEVIDQGLGSGSLSTPRYALAMQAQMLCLQRSEHVLTMHREHLAGDWWIHPGAFEVDGAMYNTKGSRPIAIAITPLLRSVIDRALGMLSSTGMWIFQRARGNRPARRYDGQALMQIRDAAGVSAAEWRPHDARKHGATALDRLGVPLDHVQRLLAHTRPRSTATVYYIQGRIAEGDPVVREVQRAWEAHLAPRLSAAGVSGLSNLTITGISRLQ